MRQLAVAALALLAPILAACSAAGTPAPLAAELVFAAVEGDGAVAVLDGETGALLRTVDLSAPAHHGPPTRFRVHNVQAAPDGRKVWATATPAGGEGGVHADEPGAEGDHGGAEQLVGLDAATLEVEDRIELGEHLHVAHVVVAGVTAFVTATDADVVLVVDLAAGKVVRRVVLPGGTGPHGARLTADGRTLVVAGMGQGSIVVIDTATGEHTAHAVPGRAVQAALLPDGSAAFATLYDTRQVARLDLATRALALFDLPAGSQGPVQLYPTPDGAALWVADQGLVDGRPAGDTLVRLDAATGEVRQVVKVGGGPHGVVVSPDGATVWVTALADGVVQGVDAAAGAVRFTTPVGAQPNGISCVAGGATTP